MPLEKPKTRKHRPLKENRNVHKETSKKWAQNLRALVCARVGWVGQNGHPLLMRSNQKGKYIYWDTMIRVAAHALEWLTNRSVLLLICCHKIRFSKLNLHKYTYNLITKNNIFSRKHHPVVTFYPSTLFTSCATVLFNRLVMVYVHKKKFLKHTPKSHGEFSLFPTDKKTWVFFKIPTVWKTQNTW